MQCHLLWKLSMLLVIYIVGLSNMSLVKETEIISSKGSEALWSDCMYFWKGFSSGWKCQLLQVYTKCGRSAMPCQP